MPCGIGVQWPLFLRIFLTGNKIWKKEAEHDRRQGAAQFTGLPVSPVHPLSPQYVANNAALFLGHFFLFDSSGSSEPSARYAAT